MLFYPLRRRKTMQTTSSWVLFHQQLRPPSAQPKRYSHNTGRTRSSKKQQYMRRLICLWALKGHSDPASVVQPRQRSFWGTAFVIYLRPTLTINRRRPILCDQSHATFWSTRFLRARAIHDDIRSVSRASVVWHCPGAFFHTPFRSCTF